MILIVILIVIPLPLPHHPPFREPPPRALGALPPSLQSWSWSWSWSWSLSLIPHS